MTLFTSHLTTLQKCPNPPPLSKSMSGHDLLLSRVWGHGKFLCPQILGPIKGVWVSCVKVKYFAMSNVDFKMGVSSVESVSGNLKGQCRISDWKFGQCPVSGKTHSWVLILDNNRSWTDTVSDPMSFRWRIWAFLQCVTLTAWNANHRQQWRLQPWTSQPLN